jgi:Domain of unknown function (DUF4214)/Putative Ig domain
VTSGSLPTGLILNASTGTVSGTPTVSNTYNFTITATDATGDSGSQAYTNVVNSPESLAFVGDSDAISPAPGTRAEEFVCSLYEGVLDRNPDATGLAHWAGEISNGIARAAVAYDIANSRERHTDEVTNDYETFLGRNPEFGGLTTFVRLLDDGTSAQQVAADILGSNEAFNSIGDADATWLTYLYEKVLHRTPDSTGDSFWLHALGDGHSRTQVAFDVETSREFDIDYVNEDYEAWLLRPAETAGLSSYVSFLERTGSENQVDVSILGSQEYFNDLP